jgi:hypothetical protein
MKIQVWDLDIIKDDVVGEGTFNLMNVYNMPNQRSESSKTSSMQFASSFSTRASQQANLCFRWRCRDCKAIGGQPSKPADGATKCMNSLKSPTKCTLDRSIHLWVNLPCPQLAYKPLLLHNLDSSQIHMGITICMDKYASNVFKEKNVDGDQS